MNENPSVTNSPFSNEITLWGTLRLLFSRWYLLLLAGVLCAALTYVGVRLFITPKYASRVSFYVYNSSDVTSHSGTINNNDLQAAESLAATYSKILGSNSVLDAILEDIGAQETLTRKELSKMVKASVISGTQLLEVVVTSPSAEFSRQVAASFARIAPTEIVRITKAGGVEVVDRPELATEKSFPRTVFDTAVGFLVGLIIISVYLLVDMLSDTTIYLPEDINSFPGVVVLGQIPTIEINSSGGGWKLEEGGPANNESDE